MGSDQAGLGGWARGTWGWWYSGVLEDPMGKAGHSQGPREAGCGEPHRSTKMPACTACTMLRNLGFSSARRPLARVCWVKVEASQSRTSEGTASDRSSCSSSSVSRICLRPQSGSHRGKTAGASTAWRPWAQPHPTPWKLPHQPLPSLTLPCLSFAKSFYFCFSITGHSVRVSTPILGAFKHPVAWISPVEDASYQQCCPAEIKCKPYVSDSRFSSACVRAKLL